MRAVSLSICLCGPRHSARSRPWTILCLLTCGCPGSGKSLQRLLLGWVPRSSSCPSGQLPLRALSLQAHFAPWLLLFVVLRMPRKSASACLPACLPAYARCAGGLKSYGSSTHSFKRSRPAPPGLILSVQPGGSGLSLLSQLPSLRELDSDVALGAFCPFAPLSFCSQRPALCICAAAVISQFVYSLCCKTCSPCMTRLCPSPSCKP
jgi:hypothetical protein